MQKQRQFWFFFLMPFVFYAQDADLPPDFRQHNLTAYNSNLFNPVFSLDRSDERTLALWTRWQWQTIDGDPTTLLFNYTHRLNVNSAGGLGFFQHNTGLFLHTGALVNYAYNFQLGGGAELAFGANLFGYQRKAADEFYEPNPDIPLPQFEVTNDFILQFAPSIRFAYNQFSIGLASENLMDYNFSSSENESSSKIYLGHMSYDIPVFTFGSTENSFIRPSLYLKTIPGLDTQFGIIGLFSTPKFWTQLGYNSYYGMSGGAGGHFFKNFSIGALIEFGSANTFQGNGTSIEFVTAYNFGEGGLRRGIIGSDEGDDEVVAGTETKTEEDNTEASEAEVAAAQQAEREKAERERDSIREAERQEAIAAIEDKKRERQRGRKKRERDSIAAELQARQLHEQQKIDSIASARREEAIAAARKLAEGRERDSLARIALAEQEAAAKAAEQEEVTPQPGEKYEETTTEDGLAPGYYLIANVFGTKKYHDAFMKTLTNNGLDPKTFFRSKNKYNYVYLERYETVDAAREARDSKFNGKYADNLWIFRVVAQ
jgi:type IX secretion system PorP/SprF family membrane protein